MKPAMRERESRAAVEHFDACTRRNTLMLAKNRVHLDTRSVTRRTWVFLISSIQDKMLLETDQTKLHGEKCLIRSKTCKMRDDRSLWRIVAINTAESGNCRSRN
jgi:hypothetical protein